MSYQMLLFEKKNSKFLLFYIFISLIKHRNKHFILKDKDSEYTIKNELLMKKAPNSVSI